MPRAVLERSGMPCTYIYVLPRWRFVLNQVFRMKKYIEKCGFWGQRFFHYKGFASVLRSTRHRAAIRERLRRIAGSMDAHGSAGVQGVRRFSRNRLTRDAPLSFQGAMRDGRTVMGLWRGGIASRVVPGGWRRRCGASARPRPLGRLEDEGSEFLAACGSSREMQCVFYSYT